MVSGKVILLWCETRDPWPVGLMAEGLERLPVFMRQEVLKLSRWQDSQARILGRLLVRAGLARLGLNEASTLRGWNRARFGRPFIQDCPADYNLSHSDGVVVAALALDGRVGVDVEHQISLELTELMLAFGPEEWNTILASNEPLELLLRFWTAKEAALKADGRGMSIDPAIIDGRGETIHIGKQNWAISRPNIVQGWICSLATSWRSPEVQTQKLEMADLLC